MYEEQEFQQLSQRVEALLGEIERVADPKLRTDTFELVQALMELHGAGLEQLMELVAQGPSGAELLEDFARNRMVASLLLLHGLHPLDLETRVRRALDQVQPYLQSHGGSVELLNASDGTVTLRLAGSCRSCPSSTATLKQTIEQAIYDAAPDVTEILSESMVESVPANSLVQLTGATANNGYVQCPGIELPK